MLLIGVTLLLLASWYAFVTALEGGPLATRVVLAALRWETAALVLVLGFAGAWLATAIAWYPPRGIDDLVYHLPLVYQAIQDHRLTVLPIELRSLFAFPLAGEMTFLWDVLIDGS